MAEVSSRRPTTADSALASLQDARNVVRRAMGVGPVLDSTNELLNAIRESTADKPEYIELEWSCAGVREVLSRGADRKQDGYLSQPALEAIDELTATTNEIKKNIVRQGKRRAIFKALRPRKDKEAIASWRLSLNKILCALEIEFGSGESPHTAVVDADSGTSSAVLTAPENVSGSGTTVSQVLTEVVNVHTLSHEADCDAANSGEGGSNPGCSTHVCEPDRLPRDTHGSIPDICSHIEETHKTVDAHAMFNGMPRRAIKGLDDNYQAAEESALGESPPPPPKIFGRDELVKEIVNLVDADDPTPIALIGTGGIGKTTVALAVLHDDRIKQRFGHHRRFLRCDQFPPSLPNFLRRLSEVIGAGIANPTDLAPLQPSLRGRKMLLLIDNAESLSGGPNAEDILAVVEELSRLRNIYLCITSRTSIVPTRCKRVDVPTLSMEAALETFYNIYRRERSDTANDILKQLDLHPLSVALLATAAKHNKWSIVQLEKEWQEQRTRLLRARWHGSLAATIELSLHSPMFRDLGPHAHDLLGVVAFFPQGVDENNLDWLFPSITDRRNIVDRFCVLSLAHRDKGFITMLAPLRDHLVPKDPVSSPLLCSTKERYFSRLALSIKNAGDSDDTTRWITTEDVNVEHLLDIFTSADANSEGVWVACGRFMHHIHLHKPRLPVFGPKIEVLPDDYPPTTHCLFKLSDLLSAVGDAVGERRVLFRALRLWRERGEDVGIALALQQLSSTSISLGLYEEGIQQAKEATTIFQRLGEIRGEVQCGFILSSLLRRVNRLDDANECETRIIGLADTLMPVADPALCSLLHESLSVIYANRGDVEKVILHSGASLGGMPARRGRFYNHCSQAMVHIHGGRFDDAEAHLERASSFAADGSSDLGDLMDLRARLLLAQGKFEEARSEALRALGVLEEFGSRDRAENVKSLLRSLDEGISRNTATRNECREAANTWTRAQALHAAVGTDNPQDKKIYDAVTNLIAAFEKAADHPGGPELLQIKKAQEEFRALVGQGADRDLAPG